MPNNKSSTKAIILSNLGGPQQLDHISPFLFDLFMDREIIPIPLEGIWRYPIAKILAWRRTKVVTDRYRRIGDGSPLVELTQCQALALQQYLEQHNNPIPVSIAMRYGRPSVHDCLQRLAPEIAELVVIPLYPQFCKATTRTTRKHFIRELDRLGLDITAHFIEHFWDHPLYLQAMQQKIIEKIDLLSPNIRSRTIVLFCVHSVPESFVRFGDPYIKQVEATADRLAIQLDLEPDQWRIAYQSRLGPVKWVGPTTEEVLDDLVRQKIESIVAVPLSFVSDHLETLYDMDIVLKDNAHTRCIHHVHRVECLNSSPLFIELLADLALKKLVSVHRE